MNLGHRDPEKNILKRDSRTPWPCHALRRGNGHSETRPNAAQLLCLLLLLAICAPAFAVDTPSNLLIQGRIHGTGDVVPRTGDNVIVVRQDNGTVESRGEILTDSGLFAVQMQRTTDFDGTELELLFDNGRRYQLLRSGERQTFSYLGSFVGFRRVDIEADIGPRVGGGSDDDDNGGSGGGSASGGGDSGGGGFSNGDGSGGDGNDTGPLTYDVNNDGVVDRADIEAVKAVVAGEDENSRADVNGDGLINTRDIINTIKAVRDLERTARRANARTRIRGN